jgi:hypothetical protein
VTNSPVNFDGLPHSANVSSSAAGTVSNILTGGAASQTNVGTYAVTANFVPTDTVNYESLTGAPAGNFVIAASGLGAGKYDDRNAAWTYVGTWTTYDGAGPYSNTSRYNNVVGSSAQIAFIGNKFAFTYVKANNRGLIDVYVDGTKIAQINAKSTTTAWQQTWTSPSLTAGAHIVRFVHAGGGTYIDVDAIQVFAPPAPVTAGTYDDTNSAWTFGGSWTTYSGAGPVNNTDHYSNVIGSDAQITFTGTGFTLNYVKASNRGSIDVYVDGVKVGTINANSTTTTWRATWTIDTLSSGTHTVRFVNAGGGYIDVDAITILP